AVSRHSGPVIVEDLAFITTQVDHGLDGEDHTRLHAGSSPILSYMTHLWFAVEDAANAMSHEVAHHRAPLGLGILLDGRSDVPDAAAGLDLGDAELEGAAGDLGHPD